MKFNLPTNLTFVFLLFGFGALSNNFYNDKPNFASKKNYYSIEQKGEKEIECDKTHTYGEPSENYIEFVVDDKTRKFYFESVDIYKIEEAGYFEKGGYKIYLPPFGFSKELRELSEIHFTWKPKESFTEDRFNFPQSGLLRHDCFFEENRRDLKKLFNTSDSFNNIPSEIKVDTLNTDKGFEIEVTSRSPENENVSLRIHVVSQRIQKHSVSRESRPALKEILSKQEVSHEGESIIRNMYYYKSLGMLRLPNRYPKSRHMFVSLPKLANMRIGNPDTRGFDICEVKKMDSEGFPQGLILNTYRIEAEKSSRETDKNNVFDIPAEGNIDPDKTITDYNLENRKPNSSYITNQVILIKSKPLFLDKSMLSKGSELPETKVQPKYKTVYQNEIPEKQFVEVEKGKQYNTYIASDKGDLYKISSQKNKDTVVYQFTKSNVFPTKYSINYKQKFKSEDEYLAYAEFLFAGEDIMDAYLFSKENSETQQKAINKITAAGLDSLIAEDKSKTLKNIREFSRSFSNSKRDYIIYDYLTHFEDKFAILNAYVNAETYLKNSSNFKPDKFDTQLKPVLDKYSIEYTDVENKSELLKTAYDSLLTEYHEQMIRVVRKSLKEDENLSIIKQSSKNKQLIGVEKTSRQNGYGVISTIKSDSLYLASRGFEKREDTIIHVTENIWDIGQFFLNIPYLNLEQGFEKDIITMDLNLKSYRRITLKYNKVKLKIIGTEKLNVRGDNKELMVIEMIPTDKIYGLSSIFGLRPYYGVQPYHSSFMIKEDGTPFALIYVSNSAPHHIHSMKLQGNTFYFLKEGEYSLDKWLTEIHSH